MRTSPRPTRARRGLTLLELLLVLAILAVVLGTGLGAFAALDAESAQASGAVKGVLRAASSAAVDRGEGARVRVDAAGGRVWAESYFTVGTWHFEGDLRGAFGLVGDGRELGYADEGWVGRALSLGPRSVAAIPVRDDPAFDPTLGFVVECAVRRADGDGGRVLSLGGAVELELGSTGAVRGRFVPQSEGHRAGAVVVQSPPGLVLPERWARIALSYDGRLLALAVDGVRVASLQAEARVAPLDGPLVLSDPGRPFVGELDGLVVRVLVRGEVVRLPEGVRFAGDTPAEVRFDAGGGLDRRFHRGPVVLALELPGGELRRLRVGTSGTVEG